MLDFFVGVAALFNMTFNAAWGVAFFKSLACCILIETAFGLFLLFYRGTRRM